MSQKFSLNINGGNHEIDADPDMPLLAAAALLFLSANLASAQDTSFGHRLFQDKADCQFCHGIDGDGRGDPRSPGQAADLHKTILNREQLIEVITCGRPGTEMPHLSVSPSDLYARLGTSMAPMLVDVRRKDAFEEDDRLIVGAFRRAPEDVGLWSNELPSDRPVVAYCSRGQEVSQGIAGALRGAGFNAVYLEGGLADWNHRNLPTRKKLSAGEKNWVTREHPKIDRIACPWLISRFINPNAEFIYVLPDRVVATAQEVDAVPYDIKGTEFGHIGDRCSFDAIVRIFDIKGTPALDDLATIVRGADTSRRDLAPQCDGLYAISFGLSANFPDDREMLHHGLVIYDALYTWCRKSREATADKPIRAQA